MMLVEITNENHFLICKVLKSLCKFKGETGHAHRRKIFSVAGHTNTSHPESLEIQLVTWDSTWMREGLVCCSYCYLLPKSSSLGHCWRQDCRLAECLGSEPVQPFISSTKSCELFFNLCISMTEVTFLRNKSLEVDSS